MRNEFARAMIDLCEKHPEFLFVTGDLGFMAFEGLKDKYRERFINAGVAEQNMVSLAAGLAHEGFIPWVYNIAPFAVLRPYEQIRNDVCLHNLPVKIVGNGGGYGYGIMGATHHTLEDIGVMRALPNMKVYVPLISSDVTEAVSMMAADPSPNYLRLNCAARLAQPIGRFGEWRKIKDGGKLVVIGTGPVVANVLEAPREIIDALEVWSVGILPIKKMPDELISSINSKKKVLTIEEHYGQCGLNEAIAALLLAGGTPQIKFKSLYSKGYPSGRYGSQRWHQEENALAGEKLQKELEELLYE